MSTPDSPGAAAPKKRSSVFQWMLTAILVGLVGLFAVPLMTDIGSSGLTRDQIMKMRSKDGPPQWPGFDFSGSDLSEMDLSGANLKGAVLRRCNLKGTNLAAAFTLFGTLAIVRVRTAIKNPLDAAFVIFSVVIGLALGNGSLNVATVGTGMIAVLILALLAVNRMVPRENRSTLKLVITGVDASDAGWRGVLLIQSANDSAADAAFYREAGADGTLGKSVSSVADTVAYLEELLRARTPFGSPS